MSDVWGNRIKLSIFGESHGPAIGIVIDGLSAGEYIDLNFISKEMARRAPGKSPFSTSRKEADNVEILSGLYNEKTTGSALCGIIRNQNARSSDYRSLLRPGHADWTALLKYSGYADMRGGGHFSGRLSAALLFAGAIAKQILSRKSLSIYGRIHSIAAISDVLDSDADADTYRKISEKDFPVYNEAIAKSMQEKILEAKNDGDSVGGIIEVRAFGVPGGLGDPFFGSLESKASSLFFSIPAVKGVEFGDGFALAAMRGSVANDAIYYDANEKRIYSKSNHNGGILGGISNAMPIVARLAIKPTPSIALPCPSIDSESFEECSIETHGRHDPCIVPRAVPVAESALALAILDSV